MVFTAALVAAGAGGSFEMTGEECAYVSEVYKADSKDFTNVDVSICMTAAINLLAAAQTKLPDGTSPEGLLPTASEVFGVFQRVAALVEQGE